MTDAPQQPDDPTCEEIIEELNELLDGACNEDRRKRLLAHIEACPRCVEAYGIENETRELLKRCCCSPAPERLQLKIKLAIREEVDESDTSALISD